MIRQRPVIMQPLWYFHDSMRKNRLSERIVAAATVKKKKRKLELTYWIWIFDIMKNKPYWGGETWPWTSQLIWTPWRWTLCFMNEDSCSTLPGNYKNFPNGPRAWMEFSIRQIIIHGQMGRRLNIDGGFVIDDDESVKRAPRGVQTCNRADENCPVARGTKSTIVLLRTADPGKMKCLFIELWAA